MPSVDNDQTRHPAPKPGRGKAEAWLERLTRTGENHEPEANHAVRFQLRMGLAGFLGGLALVVPVVLWLATGREPQPPRLEPRPASLSPAATTKSGPPALLTAPTLADRAAAPTAIPEPDGKTTAQPGSEAIANARHLIRTGDIAGARRLLSPPELAGQGEAMFMLAETYDPNVLAALGATGVLAETQTARRHYETARNLGMTAADRRLEQLR